jgi:hypothetical protein
MRARCRMNTAFRRSVQGVLPKSISATAERGSVSRSTFNSPKTHGISCARSDSGLLWVADPRSVPFGQHALQVRPPASRAKADTPEKSVAST